MSKSSATVVTRDAAGATVVNTFDQIKSAHAKGRAYTDLRNALIAREILLGTKQSELVKGTGVDKGDVSRIAKQAGAMSATAKRNLKGLTVPKSIESLTDADTAALVKRGEANFRRTVKVSGAAAKGSAPVKGADVQEGTDWTALVFDALESAPDEETRVFILKAIQDGIAAHDDARAKRAAAEDMAAAA